MSQQTASRSSHAPASSSNLPMWIACGSAAGLLLSGLYFNSKINSLQAEVEELKKRMSLLPPPDVIKRSVDAIPNHTDNINRINNALTTTFNATNNHEVILKNMHMRMESMAMIDRKVEKLKLYLMAMMANMNATKSVSAGAVTNNLLDTDSFTSVAAPPEKSQSSSNQLFDMINMFDDIEQPKSRQHEYQVDDFKKESQQAPPQIPITQKQKEPENVRPVELSSSNKTEAKSNATPQLESTTNDEDEIIARAAAIMAEKRRKQQGGV